MARGFLDFELYGGTVLQWLWAAGVASLIVLVAILAKRVVLRRLARVAAHTSTSIDDAVIGALQRTRPWLITVFAVAVGGQTLELAPRLTKVLESGATIALFLQVGIWGMALLDFWVNKSRQRAASANAGAATSLTAVGFVGRIVLWALIVLLTLDNLGINITTLVAGLGIGGIAVALAVQNILGDLFASLSIVLDKPFAIGDFIIVDNFMGTVEHIGLKTTRLRSLDGEQIVFSNSDLLKGRIKNYKRMRERRVVFKFGITYDAKPEQVQQVPQIIKGLLEKLDNARFERSHFFKFSDYSLEFETIYWMKDPDYAKYMDTQQALNLALMREFERLGLQFAFPTRTIQVAGAVQVESTVRERANGSEEDKAPRAPRREQAPAPGRKM